MGGNLSSKGSMAFKDHLDKIGVLGSFLAAACCLGLPAVLSIVSAVGLGFLINDAILRLLIIAFLAVTITGLFLGYRIHRRLSALVLGVASAFGLYFFIYGHQLKWAAYLFIVGLVAAGVLNIALRRSSARGRARHMTPDNSTRRPREPLIHIEEGNER